MCVAPRSHVLNWPRGKEGCAGVKRSAHLWTLAPGSRYCFLPARPLVSFFSTLFCIFFFLPIRRFLESCWQLSLQRSILVKFVLCSTSSYLCGSKLICVALIYSRWRGSNWRCAFFSEEGKRRFHFSGRRRNGCTISKRNYCDMNTFSKKLLAVGMKFSIVNLVMLEAYEQS